MRILFTLAHYFRQEAKGFHGSEKDPARRLRVLAETLLALHQTFGPRQALLHPPERATLPANEDWRHEIEVVVCTTGDDHLVGHLPAGLCRHHPTAAKPRLLGYECHAVLRDGLGDYDYFCFLEDDILVTDPLLFLKLEWFTGLAGDEALLQPNRFERALRTAVFKLYIDGNLVDPKISPRFQDRTQRPRLTAEFLGRPVVFQRIDNPHSGCFFLNAAQMRRWSEAPYFLDRAEGFWGPLESAATLGIMRSFAVYKPARENAAFLEVLHGDNRYLGRRLKLAEAPPHRF